MFPCECNRTLAEHSLLARCASKRSLLVLSLVAHSAGGIDKCSAIVGGAGFEIGGGVHGGDEGALSGGADIFRAVF
jgi:hypothetical protein